VEGLKAQIQNAESNCCGIHSVPFVVLFLLIYTVNPYVVSPISGMLLLSLLGLSVRYVMPICMAGSIGGLCTCRGGKLILIRCECNQVAKCT